MRSIFILSLLFCGFFSFAQRTLYEMPELNLDGKSGPNKSHFGHAIISFGFNTLDQSIEDYTQKFWSSSNFSVGGRYIRKLSNRWAWSNDFLISYFSYQFENDALDPDDFGVAFNAIERDGRLVWGFEYVTGLRFSTQKRRGNIIGRYLEIQGLGGVVLSRSQVVRGINDEGNKVVYSAIFKEDHPFYWGWNFRLGLNQISLFSKVIIADMARLDRNLILFGLELNLH
ncbi:MAG: hypothetical protein JJU02_06800 [Cryomorphaceae bacterium]|nr:hypothetical protein [Cryomorphaceae bacterium]